MAISKTKNYLVLNYNSSPVAVSTKYESYLVEGGTKESPGALPLSFDEIAYINSSSLAFKIGLLRFEAEHEKAIYEELAVPNWEDIFTLEQIEEAILHPTIETSRRILAIENDAYFERIRGVMMGLKNGGVDISNKIENMIEERRKELARRQRKTNITLVARQDEPSTTSAEIDDLKAQLAEMQKMMADMMASKQDAPAANKTGAKEPSQKAKPKNGEKDKT